MGRFPVVSGLVLMDYLEAGSEACDYLTRITSHQIEAVTWLTSCVSTLCDDPLSLSRINIRSIFVMFVTSVDQIPRKGHSNIPVIDHT